MPNGKLNASNCRLMNDLSIPEPSAQPFSPASKPSMHPSWYAPAVQHSLTHHRSFPTEGQQLRRIMANLEHPSTFNSSSSRVGRMDVAAHRTPASVSRMREHRASTAVRATVMKKNIETTMSDVEKDCKILECWAMTNENTSGRLTVGMDLR